MAIQTTYPFTHNYPRLGVTVSSIQQRQIATGLVVVGSGNIAFGTAVEAGMFTPIGANIAQVDSKYQRLLAQKAGAAIVASANFRGIALLEHKAPEGISPRHTVINDTTVNADYAPQEELAILEVGRVWARFDAAVTSPTPRTLTINYLTTGLNAGLFTTGAGTLATSVVLLYPTVLDGEGQHCGLVSINLP